MSSILIVLVFNTLILIIIWIKLSELVILGRSRFEILLENNREIKKYIIEIGREIQKIINKEQ